MTIDQVTIFVFQKFWWYFRTPKYSGTYLSPDILKNKEKSLLRICALLQISAIIKDISLLIKNGSKIFQIGEKLTEIWPFKKFTDKVFFNHKMIKKLFLWVTSAKNAYFIAKTGKNSNYLKTKFWLNWTHLKCFSSLIFQYANNAWGIYFLASLLPFQHTEIWWGPKARNISIYSRKGIN